MPRQDRKCRNNKIFENIGKQKEKIDPLSVTNSGAARHFFGELF